MNNLLNQYIVATDRNLESFRKIQQEYDKLEEAIVEVIKEHIENKEYNYKLLNQIDSRPIRHRLSNVYSHLEENTEYRNYQSNIISKIKNNLTKQKHLFNEGQLNKVLKVYNEEIQKEKEFLEVENVGSTLNTFREFYPDLYVSLKKIKKNGKKHQNKFHVEGKWPFLNK